MLKNKMCNLNDKKVWHSFQNTLKACVRVSHLGKCNKIKMKTNFLADNNIFIVAT